MNKTLVAFVIILIILSIVLGAAFLRYKLLMKQVPDAANEIRVGGLGKTILMFYAFALIAFAFSMLTAIMAVRVVNLIITSVKNESVIISETCGPGLTPLLL